MVKQHYFYGGKQLEYLDKLFDYNINHGSTIILELRLCGGARRSRRPSSLKPIYFLEVMKCEPIYSSQYSNNG